MGFLKKASETMSSGLEKKFHRLGFFVGNWPFTVIAISTVIFAVSLLGLLRFQREARIEKLWAEPGTRLFDDSTFVNKHFSEYEIAVMVGVREPLRLAGGKFDAGILEAPVIQQLYIIHEGILAINASNGQKTCTFQQMAIQQKDNNYWVTGILALWQFDRDVIMNLTTTDILKALNQKPIPDLWNGGEFNLDYSVGGLKKDSNGLIIGASAIRNIYRYYVNETFDSLGGRKVDPRGKDFSLQFQDWVWKKWDEFDKMTAFSWAGFNRESEKLINADIALIGVGYTLIFIYVSINLGRFNRLYGRVWLALSGITSTGMAIGMSFGICSAIGLFYGPLHSILPFFLIGIGVDDMFVIVQAWDSLTDEDRKKLSIPECLAKTLALAGTSVAMTSTTNFVAFCVGASTVLPALKSFCVYAGVGVFLDLCFQVTFFSATLALDAKRVEANSDSCFPCLIVKDKDYFPGHPIPERWLQHFCENYYSVYLLKLPSKIFVITASLTLCGVGVHAILQLKVQFDYFWFLPDDSPIKTFSHTQDQYFGVSIPVGIYTGKVNYTSAEVQDKISHLANLTSQSQYTHPNSVDPWIWRFRQWGKENNKSTIGEHFYNSLQTFLQTLHGRHYKTYLQLQQVAGSSENTLMVSYFRAYTIPLNHTRTEIKAMDNYREIASSVVFPNGETSFAYHWAFLPWSANKVIDEELFRNLLLAMAAVFLITLLFIADLLSAILVLICVSFTLVDIFLVIYYWGLTINTITTVIVVMSIGLSVDYSAHIAHMFMVHRGTRRERAQAAINGIGVSVLNGGVSTFLAIVSLGASNSYFFKVFFRVFFASVLFGMFHGLALLPVLLSFTRAASHKSVLTPVDQSLPS